MCLFGVFEANVIIAMNWRGGTLVSLQKKYIIQDKMEWCQRLFFFYLDFVQKKLWSLPAHLNAAWQVLPQIMDTLHICLLQKSHTPCKYLLPYYKMTLLMLA